MLIDQGMSRQCVRGRVMRTRIRVGGGARARAHARACLCVWRSRWVCGGRGCFRAGMLEVQGVRLRTGGS